MIIYTCPECGHDLESEVLTCCPPIHRKYCSNCGWSHSEKEEVIRIPFGGNSINSIDKIKTNLININGEDYLTTAVNKSVCTW